MFSHKYVVLVAAGERHKGLKKRLSRNEVAELSEAELIRLIHIQLGTKPNEKCRLKGPWIRWLFSWYNIAARKGEDRHTSVLVERSWGRGCLAGFHWIRFARESHLGQMGLVVPIGWKHMARPTVKIIYAPNIQSFFCYIYIRERHGVEGKDT